MLTSRDVARLIHEARDPDALAGLGAALGFAPGARLATRSKQPLGAELAQHEIQIAAGPGMLRALILVLERGAEARERAVLAARTIARLSPELRWLVIAHAAEGPRLFLLAPPPEGSGSIPLLEIDPTAPHPSDLETVGTLVAAAEESDLMVHQRWRETLGRDALSNRFYRELAAGVDLMATTAEGTADSTARRTIALLYSSRLLFLAFLESRDWLNGEREFLRRHFVAHASRDRAHSVQRGFLEPLFFGTLNTPLRARAAAARSFGAVPFLNGGLFTRAPIERRLRDLRFTDDAIGSIIGGLLARYRLTPRESDGAWTDAAVDPEMLGRAFESLMHTAQREARGAFYTPPSLIARLGRDALLTSLSARGVPGELAHAALAGELLPPRASDAVVRALRGLRVMDPACGSGAFLVHLLERIAALCVSSTDGRSLAEIRRKVLTRSIFGVDVDPTAVWLCQLRLWLSVVVEEPHDDPTRFAPLPNLDRNIREGDALLGDAFEPTARPHGGALTSLRLRYARANGPRKRTLGKLLDGTERKHATQRAEAVRIRATAERRELLIAARSGDLFATRRGLAAREVESLARLRAEVRRARTLVRALREGAALPFAFPTHFPEAARSGGFDLVIGNPPWVRPHAVDPKQRLELRHRFFTMREASWRAGAQAAAAGWGFAAQADLAALFTERAVHLTRTGGTLALVLPAKLWLTLSGGGVRQFLAQHAPPLHLEDLSADSAGFGAVVYPSLLLARRIPSGATPPETLLATTYRAGQALSWRVQRERLALDTSPGAPWLLLPGEVRDAFDRVTKAGTPLASTRLGRPLLGVKSGCNDAFILSRAVAARAGLGGAMLRPVLRGEDLTEWTTRDARTDACILWTHDKDGVPLAELPEVARRYLAPWRRRLELRADTRGPRWWSLFRTEAARHDRPRVVWGDIGRTPRAIVLGAGDRTVPLNTCYVVRTSTLDDAYALAALLNSSLAAAWLSVVAEPARGGYRRFLGWTCARLPLPADWERARFPLAELGRALTTEAPPDAWTLTEAALHAYDIRHADAAPLLSWHSL